MWSLMNWSQSDANYPFYHDGEKSSLSSSFLFYSYSFWQHEVGHDVATIESSCKQYIKFQFSSLQQGVTSDPTDDGFNLYINFDWDNTDDLARDLGVSAVVLASVALIGAVVAGMCFRRSKAAQKPYM